MSAPEHAKMRLDCIRDLPHIRKIFSVIAKGTRVRTITIFTHAGVVVALAGLFFGGLAWAYNSPYGFSMLVGSSVLLVLSGAFGWYYGFSPMWQPTGWEDQVAASPYPYVVSTQQFPPYIARAAKQRDGARFGTAVYLLEGEDVAEEAQPLYGLQWREQAEAEKGHRWVIEMLSQGKLDALEEFRAQTRQV